MIAAVLLGGACLIVLFFAFGRGIFGGGPTTATVKPSPSPKNTASTKANPGKVEMPSAAEQNFAGETTPIAYCRNCFYAPDPGRNIFAFYEPGKQTPYVPTPIPFKSVPPPTPAPTPDIYLAIVNPQSVYAGSDGFRMEIAGDRFTPDTKIYFEQQEIPASYVSETRMTADIPSVLIRGDGRRQIMAQTADGIKRSNMILFDIQPPPKPTFQYIGMIARKRGNNDTAYFQELGKPLPTGARLNDVVGGRFRVISIASNEAIVQDVQLAFSKHPLKLQEPSRNAIPTQPGVQPGRGFPSGRRPESYTPVSPGVQPGAVSPRIPGIPDNVPRYVPPASNSNRMPSNVKRDNDDDDDDGN